MGFLVGSSSVFPGFTCAAGICSQLGQLDLSPWVFNPQEQASLLTASLRGQNRSHNASEGQDPEKCSTLLHHFLGVKAGHKLDWIEG